MSPVTYAVEPWMEFKREALHLWARHFQEVAIDQAEVPLDIDYNTYDALDAQGMLHVIAARSEGEIVGYWLGIVKPHLHNASTLWAFTDVYYIAPEFRLGRTALRLFEFVENSLKARGVVKMTTATKTHLDMSRLFERMGWHRTEITYTKVI